MHFGASQRQISLHTGVYYAGSSDSKPQCFCTVSDELHHGPSAIWAHLQPVLSKIMTDHPELEIFHFFSDGPVTQYRQKANFFLFSKEMKDLQMKEATWDYSEAGHGKGAADGVGGAVKVIDSSIILCP
jgi:hypothetical protein